MTSVSTKLPRICFSLPVSSPLASIQNLPLAGQTDPPVMVTNLASLQVNILAPVLLAQVPQLVTVPEVTRAPGQKLRLGVILDREEMNWE